MNDCSYDLLYENYFQFRLYADFRNGASVAQLAEQYGISTHSIEERIEATRLCVEKQVRIVVQEQQAA